MIAEYTIDHQRVIAHGMGVGGQMAYYLGFNVRDLIRGVATTGAVLTNPVKDTAANQRLLASFRDAYWAFYRELRAWCDGLRPLVDPARERRSWQDLLRELGL